MANGLGKLIRTLQIDTRLLGMIGAFVIIAVIFHIATGGTFLTPRNLFTLTLQTASVAVMATGMVRLADRLSGDPVVYRYSRWPSDLARWRMVGVAWDNDFTT